MWALHRALLLRGLSPVVPTPVLAQAWRGGPHPALSRFLAGCDVEAFSELRARAVGTLAAKARHDDVVDAAVVESAVRRKHAVVTSNAGHIRQLAAAARVHLAIHEV